MSEPEYRLDWVTENIAVGCAPLSYAQLDHIREQGIDAIVNLCAEYCDLHDIEKGHGFDVYYLPIPDECAPDCEAMEKAMHWMDEILNQQKRLLIHCRLGMGRTGTLLYSYLWSRNLYHGISEDLLEQIRSRPCNFSQWRLVKRYRDQQCRWSDPSRPQGALTVFWHKLMARLQTLFKLE
ncbi:MAG: dual specificity protein phosphatase family protein [Syntrophobacteraceae bacterium]